MVAGGRDADIWNLMQQEMSLDFSPQTDPGCALQPSIISAEGAGYRIR